MSQSKLQLTITKVNNTYCVELRDHYCNFNCVYEPTMQKAMQYALYWFEKAEQRREENQAHARAVHEMARLDREAGITTSMSDGLD
jgi:cyclopropane fatty-acyl-phospholipid synthase-like methyltransferase